MTPADGTTLPHSDSTDLNTVTILAGGNPIDSTIQLLSVTVTKEVNRIPTAKLTFADGDVSTQNFPVSNGASFAPGTEIEVQCGYHSKEETIFKGLVVRHGLRTKAEGSSVLSILCKDAATKMTIGQANGYYHDAKDSDVAEELITRHGLSADVQATSVQHECLVQYQCTDWDFLLMRAEMMGQLVFVDSGKVTVKKPDASASPVLTLAYGSTILDFEADLDAESQLKAVSTAGWDAAAQVPLAVEASAASFGEAGNLSGDDLAAVLAPDDFHRHHTGRLEEAELQAWSDNLMLRSRLAKLQGRLTCQGIAAVKVGDVVTLAGLGDRFNGPVFIAAIRHDVSQGNWLTHLQIGLSERWFHERVQPKQSPAAGMLPGIEGLHVGIVTALEGDPLGEDRIRVRLPLLNDSDDGTWTRLATLDAGKERGSVFRPEIEDEVIVGFLYGDPRQSVVLGQLHSSAHAAPVPPSNDNHQKGYWSREKTEFIFDDEKPSVHIKLASGRTIMMDDDAGEIFLEDPSGNRVTLDDSGITLDSPADITIKAAGDVKIEGVNIDIKASAEFKADGGAGSKLTSSAVTTVKGSMVEIN